MWSEFMKIKDKYIPSIKEMYILYRDTLTHNFKLFSAVFLALLTVYVCSYIPKDVASYISLNIMKPMYDGIYKIMVNVIVLMVPVSFASTIACIDDKNVFTLYGKKIFSQLIRHNFMVTIIAFDSLVYILGINQADIWTMFDWEVLVTIYRELWEEIIPSNNIGPLYESNIIQLLGIGGMAGLAMLNMGERAKYLIRLTNEIYEMLFLIMKWLGLAMPLMVYLDLCICLIGGRLDYIISGWFFVPIMLGACIAYVILFNAYVAWRCDVSFVELMKDVLPVGFSALAISSMNNADSKILKLCDKYRIENEFSSLAVPITMLTSKTALLLTQIVLICAILLIDNFYLGDYGIIAGILIIFLLTSGAPVISGSSMALTGALLLYFELPAEFIDVAMAYDIIIEMALFGTMGSVVMGEILLIHHKAIDTKDIT